LNPRLDVSDRERHESCRAKSDALQRTRLDDGHLVEPVRIIRNIVRLSGFEERDPQPSVECVQTICPIDAASTPITRGTRVEYEMPDVYGCPGVCFSKQFRSRDWSGRRRKTSSGSSERIGAAARDFALSATGRAFAALGRTDRLSVAVFDLVKAA
jgi:hypothetical protein